LIVQNLKADSFGIPAICPDMTGRDFRGGWRRVRWLHRVMVWACVPVIAVIMLLFGPRRMLTGLAMDDEPTLRQLDREATMPELHELVVNARDRLLVQALVDIHERRSHEPIKVAVVYGAEHMRAVITALSKLYRYAVQEGQFVTAFDL
jgi:pheromone shutdown protein TraB